VNGKGKRLPSERRDPRRGRGPRGRLLVAAATLLALLSASGLALRGSGTAVAGAGRVAPLLAPVSGGASGEVVDGIGSGDEQVAFHLHAHLRVFANGQRRTIPYGIGVVPPLRLTQTADGPFVADGAAFYWLHTHDTSGVIHVEAADPTFQPVLGQFFDVWGVYLTKDCLGDKCAAGHSTLRAYVNGKEWTGDPTQIPLNDQLVIVLAFGSADQVPNPVPASFVPPA
jgi:hypothetical protein